jgi:hypothetical protein
MNSAPADQLEVAILAHAHPLDEQLNLAFVEDDDDQNKLPFPGVISQVRSSIARSLAAFVDSAEMEIRKAEQDAKDHMMCSRVVKQQLAVSKEAERLTSDKDEFRRLKQEMKRTGMMTNSGHREVINNLLSGADAGRAVVTRRASMPVTSQERSETLPSSRRFTEAHASTTVIKGEPTWEFV